MNLQRLLLVHAIITLAAAIVLVAAPAFIPQTVAIHITSNAYLLCYFLGAAEAGMAYLSFFSRTIKDKQALQIIVQTFIVFHAATAALEWYGLAQGISPKLTGNIGLRLLIIALFYYYGIYKNKK